MKLKLLRCAICLDWHLPIHHCPTCGARIIKVGRKKFHYGYTSSGKPVEMVRGIPLPLDRVIAKFQEN